MPLCTIWFDAEHATASPLTAASLPLNGIYFLFESGRTWTRRGATRSGRNRTRANANCHRALTQHFVNENKDRSIFRKNIGRALLNRAGDPFLADWEIDRTTSSSARRAVLSGSCEADRPLKQR